MPAMDKKSIDPLPCLLVDTREHSLLSIEQRYGVPVVRIDTP